jgi:hypothetical protein
LLLCLFIGSVAYASKPKGSDLELAGTIVAVENLFGHIYSSDKINTSYLIVRVDRIIKGQEDSPFILVRYKWRLKDKLDPFSKHATHWEINLTRAKGCSKTLRELQYVEFGSQEKTSGIMPRFRRTWGTEFELLPFDVSLPCYESRDDRISQIETSKPTQNSVPVTDVSFFVLEEDRWINLTETPLKLSLLGGGDFVFTNVSPQRILGYRLGCVDGNGGIIKRMDETKMTLTPNEGASSTNSMGISEQMEELYVCHQSRAKLAVIEVKYEDGSVWKAK